MEILKTKYDEYGWRTKVYSRNNNTEVIIQRQSNKHTDRDHEVYLDGDSLKIAKKIILKSKVTKNTLDSKILEYLKKHKKQWFEIQQISRRLNLNYDYARNKLRQMAKTGLIKSDFWKKDNKGYNLKIYKYRAYTPSNDNGKEEKIKPFYKCKGSKIREAKKQSYSRI